MSSMSVAGKTDIKAKNSDTVCMCVCVPVHRHRVACIPGRPRAVLVLSLSHGAGAKQILCMHPGTHLHAHASASHAQAQRVTSACTLADSYLRKQAQATHLTNEQRGVAQQRMVLHENETSVHLGLCREAVNMLPKDGSDGGPPHARTRAAQPAGQLEAVHARLLSVHSEKGVHDWPRHTMTGQGTQAPAYKEAAEHHAS